MIERSDKPDYQNFLTTDCQPPLTTHDQLSLTTNYRKLLTRSSGIDLIQVVNITTSTPFYETLNNFYNNPKSLIISALSYYCKRPPKKTINENTPAGTINENTPTGTIAPYTAANFYKIHKKGIRNFLKSAGLTKRQFKISVNGMIPEKPIAISTGFALPGRHTILMTPELGTTFVLGITATESLLEPTNGIIFTESKNYDENPVKNSEETFSQKVPMRPTISQKFSIRSPLTETLCTNCKRCEKACPVSAIEDDKINQKLCIQSLSSKDEVLPDKVMKNWGTRFYGCSTCQDVCPINSKRKISSKQIPSVGYAGFEVSLTEILHQTALTVHDSFKGNQIGAKWVEADVLHRNALLALIHSPGASIKENSKTTMKLLEKFSNSDRKFLSSIANYGLKK